MNIFSQQEKISKNASRWYLWHSIFTTFIPSAVLPVACAALFTLYLDQWYWIHEPFHAFVESVGSFSAVILSIFIIIMRRNQQLDPSYLWVAATLMGMGLLDGFHASVSPGKTFVWLHSLATLVGGLTFALIALPKRIARLSQLRNIPYMTAGFSVFLGVCSLLFPELLPVMAEDGKFSFGAEIMNIVGGIGFIIAWLHFCRKDDEVSRKERMLLANHCLLFGMAGLLFHFSILWDATWWLWHMLRLFAYLVILWFFLNLYNQEEKRIRESRVELRNRTEELEYMRSRLSDIIEYSPSVITLKDISGKFILANKQFDRLFGYKEKIAGKTMSDLFPTDIAELSDKEDKRIIGSACSTKREEEYQLAGKIHRTFIVDRFPLKANNDEVYGIGCIMTDITERKQAEREKKKLLSENTERIKELNCLYGLSKLAEHSGLELQHILRGMVELIASSWRHAEYAGARIILNDQEVETDNFIETKWIQEAPVLIDEEVRGRVQVCYTKQFPDIYEGPFLKEERHLINEIAVRLGNIIQRKIADKELRKAFEFNDRIIEEFPVGLSIYDHTGQCVASNSSMEKFTGFTRDQLLCTNYSEIDYWEKSGLCEAAKYSIENRLNKRHQFDIVKDDGGHMFLECMFVPFTLRDELRLLLLIDDISKRKESEERLKSTLTEKEALLKEIHHRVKNNMQIVASLMFLQAQVIENKEALDILQESQHRIKSMGLVHELLYRSVDLSRVPFKEYIETLVYSLKESYGDNNICFQIEAEGIELPVDTAIPCGLIMNELITNSFKHAFKDTQSGLLTIRFLRNEDTYTLSVSDNGAGLPDNYDWESPATLGLSLVRTLSAQLDAEVNFKNDNGLTCNLLFTTA